MHQPSGQQNTKTLSTESSLHVRYMRALDKGLNVSFQHKARVWRVRNPWSHMSTHPVSSDAYPPTARTKDFVKDDALRLEGLNEPRQAAAVEATGAEVEQVLASGVQPRYVGRRQRLDDHVPGREYKLWLDRKMGRLGMSFFWARDCFTGCKDVKWQRNGGTQGDEAPGHTTQHEVECLAPRGRLAGSSAADTRRPCQQITAKQKTEPF